MVSCLLLGNCYPLTQRLCLKVRTLLEVAKERQSHRISRERADGRVDVDIFEIQRDDLLGPKATQEALQKSVAYNRLLELDGLKARAHILFEIFYAQTTLCSGLPCL